MKVIFYLFTLLFILCPTYAKADLNYTVEPIKPANQIDQQLNYFYLYEISQTDTFKIKVVNTSSKAQKMYLQIVNANNNDDGELDYSGQQKDSSLLKVKLTDLVSGPESIEVPAHDSKEVSFQIKLPKDKFKGIVMGGIIVSNFKNSDINGYIANTYNYTVGVVLTCDKNAPMYQDKHLKVNLTDDKKDIRINLINDQPAIYSNEEITVKVSSILFGQKYLNKQFSSLNIAPYQTVHLSTPENQWMNVLGVKCQVVKDGKVIATQYEAKALPLVITLIVIGGILILVFVLKQMKKYRRESRKV